MTKIQTNNRTILVLAAHPDDEVLGCGGVIQKHKALGDKVQVCIVTRTQYARHIAQSRQRNEDCSAANSLLGVDEIISLDFPDLRLDSTSNVQLNQQLESVFSQVTPSIVYTHSLNDLNQDHVAIAKSTNVTCRPGKPYLNKVYAYEVLSSSEWSKTAAFYPDTFIDITPYLETKIKAFVSYSTEVRQYPHPRSPEGIKILSQYRGIQANMIAAEAFKLIVDYGF